MGLTTSFEKLGFQYQVLNPKLETQICDTPEKLNVFNFQLIASQQFLILSFVLVQTSAVKPGICNLFLSYCFLMLSSKTRFSNPVFQNSCSNSYFWGVKTRVSKFGFKTDNENPKLEKLNFWSTLIGLHTAAYVKNILQYIQS